VGHEVTEEKDEIRLMLIEDVDAPRDVFGFAQWVVVEIGEETDADFRRGVRSEIDGEGGPGDFEAVAFADQPVGAILGGDLDGLGNDSRKPGAESLGVGKGIRQAVREHRLR